MDAASPKPVPDASDSRPPSVSQLPLSIPGHELIRCIGRGAYGEVWLARNTLGTLRAVKIVHRQPGEQDLLFDREFKGLQAAEPVSRGHEGLVDILQVGRDDHAGDPGHFFYVMELADDAAGTRSTASDSSRKITDGVESVPTSETSYVPRTIHSDLKHHGALPLADCLCIASKLASALDYLHTHGLVHRDIKPSNIIFVQGEPKLADVGLVANLDDARSLVGTAGYIAPEGPGTPQADLFSLGKVLYEMAFGKHRQEFPQLPADLPSRPDHARLLELNEVILKACESDRRHRYASAEEMWKDLEVLQRGQSVKRARLHKRWRAWTWKAALTFLLVAVMALLVRGVSRERVNPSDRLSANPLAVKEYQEGMQCSRRDTPEGFQQGITHFKRAIELDPRFAMAYNGLYEIYVAKPDRPEVKECVSKMLELESNLAEAHAARGYLGFLNWQWQSAEPHFRRAIELNPKCAVAHMRYGFCLVYAGRPDDGYRELSAAEYLNPASPRIKKNLGHVFYVKRQFREAIAQYQKAIDVEPSYPTSHAFMGQAHRALSNYAAGIDEMEKFDLAIYEDKVGIQGRYEELRRAYAEGGPRGYWIKQRDQGVQNTNLYWQAQATAHLDDYPHALDLLESHFAATKLESLESLLFDECWDPVHDDPRFVALLKMTGLRK